MSTDSNETAAVVMDNNATLTAKNQTSTPPGDSGISPGGEDVAPAGTSNDDTGNSTDAPAEPESAVDGTATIANGNNEDENANNDNSTLLQANDTDATVNKTEATEEEEEEDMASVPVPDTGTEVKDEIQDEQGEAVPPISNATSSESAPDDTLNGNETNAEKEMNPEGGEEETLVTSEQDNADVGKGDENMDEIGTSEGQNEDGEQGAEGIQPGEGQGGDPTESEETNQEEKSSEKGEINGEEESVAEEANADDDGKNDDYNQNTNDLDDDQAVPEGIDKGDDGFDGEDDDGMNEDFAQNGQTGGEDELGSNQDDNFFGPSGEGNINNEYGTTFETPELPNNNKIGSGGGSSWNDFNKSSSGEGGMSAPILSGLVLVGGALACFLRSRNKRHTNRRAQGYSQLPHTHSLGSNPYKSNQTMGPVNMR